METRQTACRNDAGSEWFIPWFDSVHYRNLYAHRDEAEAVQFVDRLVDRLRPGTGATMLDLACGAGRHARCLASRGFRVLGIDSSSESIGEARKDERPNLWFRRQDMRLPFGNCAFDYVFNLFTSFGYFADPAEHLTVVHNIAQSLKPGGRVVLDYLNVTVAERRLVDSETTERAGVSYRVARWADADHIFKRIIVSDGAAAPLEYVERVAKLKPADFQFMFELCDMNVEETYGDYALSPFDANASPRLIVVARKCARVACPSLPARQVLADAADGFGSHAEIGGEHRLRYA